MSEEHKKLYIEYEDIKRKVMNLLADASGLHVKDAEILLRMYEDKMVNLYMFNRELLFACIDAHQISNLKVSIPKPSDVLRTEFSTTYEEIVRNDRSE